jgi:AraC-like DNA-binding protein
VSHSSHPARGGRSRAWPVTALAKDYAAGWHVPTHRHRRGQVVYAESGVMRVTTREGIWMVPPQRALWMPVGMPHDARMEGRVAARTLYLDRATSASLGARCKIVVVTKLLRELILEAVRVYGARDARRMRLVSPLLLNELRSADEGGMCIPTPSDPRLARVCSRVLGDAASADTIDQLAQQGGASSRTMARLFERELKMSFVRWRQHVRLARALSQMTTGDAIKTVARDAGYASCSAFSAMFKRVLGVTPTRYLGQPKAGRPSR